MILNSTGLNLVNLFTQSQLLHRTKLTEQPQKDPKQTLFVNSIFNLKSLFHQEPETDTNTKRTYWVLSSAMEPVDLTFHNVIWPSKEINDWSIRLERQIFLQSVSAYKKKENRATSVVGKKGDCWQGNLLLLGIPSHTQQFNMKRNHAACELPFVYCLQIHNHLRLVSNVSWCTEFLQIPLGYAQYLRSLSRTPVAHVSFSY